MALPAWPPLPVTLWGFHPVRQRVGSSAGFPWSQSARQSVVDGAGPCPPGQAPSGRAAMRSTEPALPAGLG